MKPLLGMSVLVRIETPKGSFAKRDGSGMREFISPFPCPFHYGSIEGTKSEDGDPDDAVVLTGNFVRNEVTCVRLVGVVQFVDDNVGDPKWIAANRALTSGDLVAIEAFFRSYAWFKRQVLRTPGSVRFCGLGCLPADDCG